MQFPRLVPVKGAAAPAPAMSRKSAFDIDTAAAVIVLAVPITLDLISILEITDVPVIDRVPVTVMESDSTNSLEPVTVRSLHDENRVEVDAGFVITRL